MTRDSTSRSGEAHFSAEERFVEALEALERLVELHEQAQRSASNGDADGLVDAATLGKVLGVSRQFVYDHADELGVLRLGSGSRPRLRFDPVLAKRKCGRIANVKRPAGAARPTGERRRRVSRPDLLPIRGG